VVGALQAVEFERVAAQVLGQVGLGGAASQAGHANEFADAVDVGRDGQVGFHEVPHALLDGRDLVLAEPFRKSRQPAIDTTAVAEFHA